jgi:hypothetical protein
MENARQSLESEEYVQAAIAGSLRLGTTAYFHPSDLVPTQPRSEMNRHFIKRLTNQIRSQGYPLNHEAEVYVHQNGITYIVNGHNHHEAAKKAGTKLIPGRILSERELADEYKITPEQLTIMATERSII